MPGFKRPQAEATVRRNQMMRLASATLFCLVLASRILAQEHAPTADVCRADQAAWYDVAEETDYINQESKHISDGIKNTNRITKLSVQELSLRTGEMGTCMSVDQPNLDKYHEMLEFYNGVLADRYWNFIVRHHLLKQFKGEDAAGVR
jgi:hypothetical protein